MADLTAIEWTDATWNPITGCSVVSPGCTNCYAMRLAGTRLRNHPSRAGLTIESKAGPVWNGEVRFNERALLQPLSWKRPRMIFVCAHGDLFHESVPDAWIDQVFAVMALAPQHIFQVLTKRSDRMFRYLSDFGAVWRIYETVCDMTLDLSLPIVLIHPDVDATMAPPGQRIHLHQWPLPNVWLGVSVEDQKRAEERIPDLLATPAAIRWISAEPLLGPINLRSIDISGDEEILPLGARWLGRLEPGEAEGPRIDWVVAGGESGPAARPMHPAWAHSLRDQCAAADVPFLFKQWGEFRPCTKIEMGHACGATKVETGGASPAFLLKVGKKRAGRELDGVIHDAFPAPGEVPAL
jgi:protein gp37